MIEYETLEERFAAELMAVRCLDAGDYDYLFADAGTKSHLRMLLEWEGRQTLHTILARDRTCACKESGRLFQGEQPALVACR